METNEAERRRWNDELWTSVWPRRELLTSAVTDYLLEHLSPSEGDRVLDIGPGGGTSTFAIASRVGVGRVVGADISGPLVDLATRRAKEQNISNVSFVVADAQQDNVEGAPFDDAASQFGVMFFDDPVQAFANVRAHLVPGGRFAFVCWQYADRNPWQPSPALASFIAPPPRLAPGKSPTGPFSLADPDATTALLETAGWSDVTKHAYELVVTIERDAIIDDDQLRYFGIAEDDLGPAREAVDNQLATLARDDGRYDAPLAFQVFTATNASF